MSDITWKVESRKISSLKDFSKNPRKISKDQEIQLKTSLDKFGLAEKPVINLDDTIIGGHQRKKILKKLGCKEIECMVPSRLLTNDEVDELNLRLNKNQAEFDLDNLLSNFQPSILLECGFDPETIKIDVPDGLLNQEKSESNKKKHACPKCGFEFN